MPTNMFISEEEYEDFQRLDRRQLILMSEFMVGQRNRKVLANASAASSSSPDGTLSVSVGEAAKVLGISRYSVYEAVRRGQIPTVRLGRRILIPRRALEELFNISEQNESL